MNYKKELIFVEKLLTNFRLKLYYISENSDNFNTSNTVSLKNILNYDFSIKEIFSLIDNQCKPNFIYRINNGLLCNYILFQLPDFSPTTYACIGPYSLMSIPRQSILNIAAKYHIAPGNLIQLEQFYSSIPILSDENTLLTLVYTLGEYLWGDYDNFSVVDDFKLDTFISENIIPLPEIEIADDASLTSQLLEERYNMERQLMQAVTAGKLHKAEMYFSNLASLQYEQRTDNPVRDMKNYAIIVNTLLRKSAEYADVHPIHIHTISSQYAHKIELINSNSSFLSLLKEMVRKYTLMVKNNSLKGYSLLIRKVITAINYDLTADLSLSAQAKELNINPSYLSTLFKKETGSTLTDFVNHKRIEHAILLLNSTDMQIQTIALYCGIPDVNYFTKTFKK